MIRSILCTLPLDEPLREKIGKASPPFQARFLPCRDGTEVAAALDESVEILFTGAGPSRIDHAPNLRWVQFNSAGINHALQSPVFEQESVTLTTGRGVYDVAAAEFALGFMLSLCKNFPIAMDLQRTRKWCPNAERLNMFPNSELRGKTVGIVGYGGIGQEIARLCAAFGMKPIALVGRGGIRSGRRYRPPELRPLRLPRLHGQFHSPEGLLPLLEQSDYVVIALPLTRETEGMINAAALARMKKTAYLVNIARGKIVDETALIHALKSGAIAGAALDVFAQEPLPHDSPFYELPNVIITPHLSGAFEGMYEGAAAVFLENLERYNDGKRLLNIADRKRGY